MRGIIASLVVHGLDVLLDELEGREEDGVDRAGTSHGDAQAAVHLSPKELDFDWRHLFAFRVHEGVALVDAFGGVYRVWTRG